jgi:hypothetical protein
MRATHLLALAATVATASSWPAAAIQERAPTAREDVWKPAATPRGGVSSAVLEATKELTRVGSDGYIRSKPVFTKQVKALAGKRVKVAGWMSAFEPSRKQTHFLLMAYPPGCPFHFHAIPNQFIEVKATTAFPLNESKPIVVTGTLELTGEDESGIFYRLTSARPV